MEILSRIPLKMDAHPDGGHKKKLYENQPTTKKAEENARGNVPIRKLAKMSKQDNVKRTNSNQLKTKPQAAAKKTC